MSEHAHPIEPLINAHQAAAILGVHTNWIYKASSDGRLPSYQIGGSRKYRATDLEAFIQNAAQAKLAVSNITPLRRRR